MTDPQTSRQAVRADVEPHEQAAASFHAIFASEFEFVRRSLRRLGVREADVNDVAQELFVAVHRNLSELDPTRSVRPWLMGFAVRFAANYRRLGWHRGDGLNDATGVRSPRIAERLAARQLVGIGLDALDFDKRVALVMHDLEGVGAPEIAAALGIPLNTVYSRVRLAREAFREAIKSVEPPEGGAS